jgi:hypothetical protein
MLEILLRLNRGRGTNVEGKSYNRLLSRDLLQFMGRDENENGSRRTAGSLGRRRVSGNANRTLYRIIGAGMMVRDDSYR